jgi:hypothetical protein
MQNHKQVSSSRQRWEADDELEESLISNEEMDRAVADGAAISISVVIDFARFYEGEWWVSKGEKGWLLADSATAATFARRREQFLQADASVADNSEKRYR